ncbi:SDR family NAD(P)-dependent oxidoreductase [Noviherbaspirillum sp. CPCC 100848]|uniref:SDR family NAD(P)-dependent oxidoreductase n=1 Tax=Noviherbaspirillum album TaxID=3080276 RepID=A0ABU6J2K8_9BURK|nr:SDR family NAD(P)-dependent oxidoreductase [Noviherbaspirillum sp. CPCC 100848]MEC4717666.1 SDR family NAD(P)-dependent oxidoreductase [Noviherbaspirillum sp. CPCC 100848]
MTTSETTSHSDLIRFDNQVAIVTGAGGGLGRSHALQLAARGARVVVNDLGVSRDGAGAAVSAAQRVVDEIREAGGEAIASPASVTDPDSVAQMVDAAMQQWGRIDILVNNAGFLRDRSFSKMSLEDFRAIVDVHLMGAVYCTKAVWDIMKQQNYGRIVMTTSSSGLFGNFGQANYGAAKMALVGLMQTLAIEGEKYNVRVNCLAPTAATRMTEELMQPDDLALLTPESVTPGMLYLVSRDAPTKTVLCAGAGTFSRSSITLSDGLHIGTPADAAEQLAASAGRLADRSAEIVPASGFQQSQMEVAKARAARS